MAIAVAIWLKGQGTHVSSPTQRVFVGDPDHDNAGSKRQASNEKHDKFGGSSASYKVAGSLAPPGAQGTPCHADERPTPVPVAPVRKYRGK